MKSMTRRTFALLAVAALLALNATLLLVQPGLALRKALVTQLFGPKMIRAEVIKWTGPGTPPADIRLDRGVIIQVSSTQLTLRERDTKVQSIPLSSTTDVIRFGHHLPPSVLAKSWHVVVTWPANGAAQTVDVEKVPRR